MRFKFVLRNPRKLFYPMIMRGGKNIFKLDQELRDTAMKLVQKVPTLWCEYTLNNYKFEASLERKSSSQIQPQSSMNEEIEKEQQIVDQSSYFNVDKVEKVKVVSLAQMEQESNKNSAAAQLVSSYVWGMLVANILSASECTKLASFLEQKMPQQKSKKFDSIQLKVTNHFPYVPSMIASVDQLSKECSLINDKSLVQKQFGLCTIFFLKASDKNVVLELDVFCVMVLGATLQVTVKDGGKKQIDVQEGQALIIKKVDEALRVNFSRNESPSNSLIEIGQDYNYKSWLLAYSQV